MPRTNLAEVSEDAPYGYKPDGTPRKRPAREATGPRKQRPVHVLFRAVDENGQAVPNVKIEVLYAGKDSEKAMEILDTHKDVSRTKINLTAEAE